MRSRLWLIGAAFALFAALPAQAESLVTFKKMTLEVATKLAQATITACRNDGYQVAVAVVDPLGGVQVVLRDRYAGAHTPDTASRKAWTAVSFRTNTIDLLEVTKAGMPQAGVRQVTNALVIGGGVQVMAGGALVGGVGVSGAPGGDNDHACAIKGLEAVVADLEF